MRGRRDRGLAVTLALVGVSFIFGGEALCIFGPLRYQRAIAVICHTFLYAGIALVGAGAAVQMWADRRRPKV